MRPVSRALTRMHESQHVDRRADRVTGEHEDDQVWEAPDRVSATHVVSVTEHRKAQGHLEDVAHALTHLREELLPEARDGIFIAGRGLVELLFGLRLDEEPGHLARSLASIRSNTSSAGRPFESPERTRAARRAISSPHACASPRPILLEPSRRRRRDAPPRRAALRAHHLVHRRHVRIMRLPRMNVERIR